MRQAPEFERMLVRSGIHLVKLWFSVSRAEQRTRFMIRQVDPVRQWKLSPIDLASLDKWDDYTEAKEAMFFYTDTADAPWTVVKSNDKKRARLEAMRHVLTLFDYTSKDAEVVGEPDPLIVRSAADVLEEATPSRCRRSDPSADLPPRAEPAPTRRDDDEPDPVPGGEFRHARSAVRYGCAYGGAEVGPYIVRWSLLYLKLLTDVSVPRPGGRVESR